MKDTIGKEITAVDFVVPPKIVGGYRLGKELTESIQFNLTYKPNPIHRFFMRICLGWYWFDNK